MGIYNKLPDVDYLAVVVQGSVDTMHRGAVMARVLGVTDELDDEDQPYFYPALRFERRAHRQLHRREA